MGIAGSTAVERLAQTNLPQVAPAQADSASTAMVIRTGEARLEVDSLEQAINAVHQLAVRFGGIVVRSVLHSGQSQRSADVVVRVPAARFDEAMSAVAPLGDLESASITSEDVGEEYVDIQAQLRNRRQLEERLLQLLSNRAGSLEDVLAVERELARVREEIDRQEARLRYLQGRVTMSTLSIYLHEPTPLIPSRNGQHVVVEAFRSAWRNFVLVITGGIASLGVLIPLAFFLWLVWLVRRSYRTKADLSK